ncbi:GIY-YIG nuclease family protein [Rhizobium metallidurans]|uniref:Bacteriophage T5 Orf172 DNA-binding domain-containing protein n=1 Tax=Rhizobium metallidurans TaxID=1265931 RepID=A0A7W6CVV5_9HYPH|nr:GIY-YIG nuclease family protein [Rhizobium metallidurans]MBB3967199.1 hypothetical protein [Rhizobium metallidurans]
MAKKTLDDILSESDELGLLANLKPVAAPSSSEDRRVQQKFEEINSFIDRYHRFPGQVEPGQKVTPTEKMLQFALKGIKENDALIERLASYDRHGLLANKASPAPSPQSIDDILAAGDELLTTVADDIFVFNRAPAPKAVPDRKSERRPCDDFEYYKPLFDQCTIDLKEGVRKARPFANEQEIRAGEFFILNGQMLYVAAVLDRHIRNGKTNARLRVIFDNGTEGDNLLRSLSAELYKDPNGRRITKLEADSGPLFEQPEPSRGGFAEEAGLRGEIYIARSLSSRPEIVKLNGHLFKIGFTTGSTEARIAAAKDDPTFLLAPAHPVRVYRVYDMDTVRFENLIHRFLAEARLDIEIRDRFGKPVRPREWFLLPLETVEKVVAMLVDGSIVHHRYDGRSGTVIPLVK